MSLHCGVVQVGVNHCYGNVAGLEPTPYLARTYLHIDSACVRLVAVDSLHCTYIIAYLRGQPDSGLGVFSMPNSLGRILGEFLQIVSGSTINASGLIW